MGQGSGAIQDVKSSREIVEGIVREAEEIIARMSKLAAIRV
jgi:hypothetical protein